MANTNKQPGQADGMNYVPKEISSLMTDYQNDPDNLSARQAVFSKLYNNGGDQRKLAMSLATNDAAQGYDGLRSQLIAAYTPQDQALGAVQRLARGKRGRNDVPNLAAVQQNTTQAPAPEQQVGAGGVYQNLPQNSALLFLHDPNNQ